MASLSMIFTMVLFLLLSLFLTNSKCDKILFMAQLPAGRSHFNVFEPIIDELGRRNHDITVHSFFPVKNPRPNINVLHMKTANIMDNIDFSIEEEITKNAISRIRGFPAFAAITCEVLLAEETTKALVAKGKQFDLVIVDALFPECALSVATMLGKNTMYLYTSGLFPWLATAVPAPPSYVPNSLEPFSSKMSFFQRMQNGIDAVAFNYVGRFEVVAAQQAILTKMLPEAPSVVEAQSKVSFHLTNADPVLQSPRPSLPNVAHCGGMHCRDPKPLPKDLNDFVESSGENGFIIFGLGSNTQAKMLSEDFRKAVLSAFSRLKQNVIWKLDARLDNLPKNVKIVDWMPQQDLLGHPKARLFISHAGLLSLQETVYHGVPVLAMPLFAEQPVNAARVKEIEIGDSVDFLNVTADGFYEQITRVLNDGRYKENVKKYSAVFKDQPEKPVERAAFWIEYVIRHNGARHFRSAAEDLNFFQYLLLDVIAFVSFVSFTILGIILYLGKLILKKVCSKKKTAKELEKKRK